MGLFNRIKNMFKHVDEEEIEEERELDEEEQEEVVEQDENLENEIEDDFVQEEQESKNEVVYEPEKKETRKERKKRLKEEKKEAKKETNKEEKEEIKESVKVYEKGLTKTRENFVSRLISLTKRYNKVSEEYFDELEEILIMADIGIDTVMSFMDRLRKRVRTENIEDVEYLKEVIVDELFIIYVSDEIIVNKINYSEKAPTVILFVGVNGVGKTTTIAKIASKLHDEGKSVMMIAGDTFRAGAIEQLKEWAERTNSDFYGKDEGADPSSVIYDGLEEALKNKTDVVLIDTAGRLQNKDNLMRELEKINKVIGKIVPDGPHETLLVIDATTGQNGISQAKAFKEITNVTGIVLTKLDGTAKGGIVLAIKESVGIPVKYIGLGERKEDLQVFDIEKYIYGLFKDMM